MSYTVKACHTSIDVTLHKKENVIWNEFNEILSLNLTQHIIHDLLITRISSILATHNIDSQISDHNNILFDLNMKKSDGPKMFVQIGMFEAETPQPNRDFDAEIVLVKLL